MKTLFSSKVKDPSLFLSLFTRNMLSRYLSKRQSSFDNNSEQFTDMLIVCLDTRKPTFKYGPKILKKTQQIQRYLNNV